MKQKFSTKWISSTQPRKQRKYIHNAPLHIRHKFLSANLSKELRKKYGKRALPLRKGDEVLVMRGAFKKKKAKVISVDLQRINVELEAITRTKKDGTKVPVKFSPSSLQIHSLNLEDSRRLKSEKPKSESKSKEDKNASEKA